jgi:magnesium transporter
MSLHLGRLQGSDVQRTSCRAALPSIHAGRHMADDIDMTVMPAPPFRSEQGRIHSEFVKQVEKAIAAADAAALRQLAGDLHEADLGDLLEALDPELRSRLIELMGHDFDFTALTEVDETIREDILEELPTETVAEGLRELESDDAVEILKDLPKEEQTEILDQLPPPERVALARSLDYPEDSAGRRMQTEFIAVPPLWTVGRTIDYMRETDDLPERFFEIYVVDAGHRFLGAVPLDLLLRTKRPVPVSELMEEDRYRVRATDDQEEVARMFEHYDLVAVPVVDAGDRLVGVITHDDIVDVISQEAEEDIRALGGVSVEEELSDSVWTIARSRFNWLLVNLATAFLASLVLGLFAGELQKMVALAVLAPIVASQGGNATTQTMTVVVRALATRDLTDVNARRIIIREILVGLVNGIAFAVITGALAYAWFKVPGLGFVIGLAMICNLLAAALGGVLIPLLLNRLKIDPAVASSPFVTTVTDVVGFFAFLGIATLWFGLR